MKAALGINTEQPKYNKHTNMALIEKKEQEKGKETQEKYYHK